MSDLKQMTLFPDKPQSPEEIGKRTPFQVTIELFEQHLRKEGKSDHTITAFNGDLSLFGEHQGWDIPIAEFKTGDLNKFLDWLEHGRGISCSRKSYARRVTTLKVYFKWLKGLGAISQDPADAVLQRSGPAPLSNVLSMSQIRHAVAFSRTLKKGDEQDYRPEMLLRLLIDTGLKKSETVRLKPGDIDRLNPNQPFVIVRHKSRNVYKERLIDLDPDWLKVFDVYQDQYPRKPGHEEFITCTARNLEYILTEIGEGAEIPFKLSFEVLRWTCAVRDHRLGMEERAIREKLGLSEPSWHETSAKIKQLATQLATEGD
jgi:integrase/recombinase XerD